jgi:hypothetical protein
VTGQRLAAAGEDGWWQQISSTFQDADFFIADFGCATKKFGGVQLLHMVDSQISTHTIFTLVGDI